MFGFHVAFVIAMTASAAQMNLDSYSVAVTPPKGFHLKQLPHVISIEQSGHRYNETVLISIVDQPPPLKGKEKSFGDRTLNYATIAEDGGSGGTEFTTAAYEKIGDRYVKFEHHSQGESSKPNLELLWKIVESAKVSK